MPDQKKPDASRERGTPTQNTGSPFPDPRAPKRPRREAEVVSGQPIPAIDRPDDGGIRAIRDGTGIHPDQLTAENDG